MENQEGKIYYGLGLDYKQLQDDASQSMSIIKKIGDTAEAEGSRIDNAFGKAGTAIGGVLTLAGASSFVQKMFSIRAAFQDTESSMTVFLGSADKAAKFMKELQDYAWYNMFEFSDLTSESAKLLAFRTEVEDIIPTLDKLSNIAAGTNKPLSEFVDLYNKAKSVGKIDAAGLESWANKGVVIVDELKEMGLEVDRSNVKFEHLEKVLNKLTSSGGMFAGLMAEQMNNLSASYGQLQDDVTNMFNELGIKYQDAMKQGIEFGSVLVANYETIGKAIAELVVVYGVYRTALAANAAIERIRLNLIYETEVAELNAILAKEKSAFADIEASVASGKLTKAKAEELIAIRLEVAAKLDGLKVTAETAKAELVAAQTTHKAALQRALASKAMVSQRQMELSLAKLGGDAAQIELAQKSLLEAQEERHTAVKGRKNTAEALAIARSKSSTAATALQTMETRKNTVSQTTNTVSTNILSLAKVKLTSIAARLNATIMANPFAFAAAGVLALAYGIYKLVSYQTEAEKAQKRLNETIKEFNRETASEQAEIDRLFDKLKNTSKESANYQKVKDEIINKYGSYLEGLRKEIKSLNDVEAAYRAISVAAKQAAIDRAIANATKDAQDSYAEQVEKINDNLHQALLKKMSPGAADAFLETINMELEKTGKLSDTTKKKLEQFNYTVQHLETGEVIGQGNSATFWIDKLNENKVQLDQTYKNIQKRLGISVNEYENLAEEQVDTYMSAFEKAIEKRSKTGNKQVIELSGGWVTFESDEELNLHLAKLKDVKEQFEKGSSVGEQVSTKNKNYWEKQKSEAEAARNALDVSKKNSDEWNGYTKQIAEAQKELEKYSNPTTGKKAESEYQKRIEAEQKYKLTLSRYELENVRVLEDLEMQVAQARINAMDEGSEKTIAQLELNHKKEIQTIDRQKEDYLRKKIDDARSVFEANPANKGKTFDSSNISLSDNETKYFDSLYQSIALAQSKSVDDLLDKYQDYAAERLAIEKKYNDDIEVLRSKRKKAEKDGNNDLVKELDSAIAQATLNKGKDLISFDFSKLKESPEYVRAFEDLKNTSSETLNALLEQLDSMKGKAAEVLNPTELREYTSTIQDIINELVERDPFKALSSSQKELSKAEKELAAAEKTLSQVRNGAKIITKTEIDQNGKIVETFLSEEEAINEVNKSRDKYIKSSNNVVKAQRAVKEKTDELYSALSDVGNALGGTTGEIISFIADIGLFVNTSIEGMKSASQAASTSLQAIEKASVILAIISAVIQLIQKLNSLIPSAYDEYLQYAEKIAEINKLKDAVNQYEIAVLKAKQAEESWFATDNLNSLKQAREHNEKVLQAYIDKATEAQAIYQNQSGGGWLTGAINWVMGNLSALSWWDEWRDLWGVGGYDEGQTAAINNLRIETRKKSSGFLGSGIGGKSQKTEDLVSWARNQGLGELFDDTGMINKELAQSLIDNYGNKLVGQTKETLEALIELREQYDEYLEQLREYVSSLYEPLVDNFVDSLWDWFDEGKDALDSFKSYASDTFRDIVSDMMRTIVLENVVKGFSDDISELYKKYASGGMSEVELMEEISKRTAGLISDYEKNIPMLQEVMENITGSLKDMTGIDLANSPDSSREASSKGFASMSQDSADELNGRFTAIQVHTFEINESLKNLVPYSKITSETTLEIRNSMESLRTNSAAILVHLAGIERNTGRLESIENDMKAVKDGINDINLKGITIKK